MPLQPTTPHADHDRLLVATYAAGDATGAELDRAIELVAACPDCAALHHDLRAIAAALPGLPPPVRTRDFRLSPEQAASLRPSGLRRLLVPLAGSRFAFAAPLGTGLATLGVAGLLLAGSLGTPLANDLAGGGAPTPETAQAAAATEAPPIEPGEAPLAVPAPSDDGPHTFEGSGGESRPLATSGESDTAAGGGAEATAAPAGKASVAPEVAAGQPAEELAASGEPGEGGANTGAAKATAPPAPTTVEPEAGPDNPPAGPAPAAPLLLLSGALLAIGVALLLARIAGRRLGAG